MTDFIRTGDLLAAIDAETESHMRKWRNEKKKKNRKMRKHHARRVSVLTMLAVVVSKAALASTPTDPRAAHADGRVTVAGAINEIADSQAAPVGDTANPADADA